MEIDIRKNGNDEVTSIRFWGNDPVDANVLYLDGIDTNIADGYDEVHIRTQEHAEYLIKALQKAIDLGNWG